jgi:hypothetical protein
MFELGQDAALLVLGLAVIVVVAWGASISVRSASRGPRWALDHLAAVRPAIFGGVILGLVLTAVVSPLWVGLAVLYVALTVLLLSSMLRRSLTRLEEAGGLDDLPIERRKEIVRRARAMILVSGLVLAGVGLLGSASGAGPVAWIPALLGLTLVMTAVSLSAEGRNDV